MKQRKHHLSEFSEDEEPIKSVLTSTLLCIDEEKKNQLRNKARKVIVKLLFHAFKNYICAHNNITVFSACYVLFKCHKIWDF